MIIIYVCNGQLVVSSWFVFCTMNGFYPAIVLIEEQSHIESEKLLKPFPLYYYGHEILDEKMNIKDIKGIVGCV